MFAWWFARLSLWLFVQLLSRKAVMFWQPEGAPQAAAQPILTRNTPPQRKTSPKSQNNKGQRLLRKRQTKQTKQLHHTSAKCAQASNIKEVPVTPHIWVPVTWSDQLSRFKWGDRLYRFEWGDRLNESRSARAMSWPRLPSRFPMLHSKKNGEKKRISASCHGLHF